MIECQNITKSYQTGDTTTEVIKGVSFTVANGEFVAIMGPSGSGKSTLMHILGALDTPTSGTYLLQDKNVSSLSDDQLADFRIQTIGFVFQQFNLLPRATVLRNVMLPLLYSNIKKPDRQNLVEQALRSTDLTEERWHHASNQLSGGQMQRVAIARALVNNPSLILADEPTGNLDSKTGEIVLNTFQHLNQRDGKTIILITHERYVAEHAQRIIEIRDGTIVSDQKIKQRSYLPPDK